ncbi:hypothetical protein DesLBE_4126 [Desulfitobacterium sp. LBE]|uniref:hypothetical protein n=1 Tax=Desulfitobacterium sp. LBE TaxID=884086 RepID=UPI00119B3374|nr:hypothetical protein [Desulfitobacterium sp. LBE]TWH59729.1 hypothetical protein DesLBE_4126 [Desulfitobacterium sp. LBE]
MLNTLKTRKVITLMIVFLQIVSVIALTRVHRGNFDLLIAIINNSTQLYEDDKHNSIYFSNNMFYYILDKSHIGPKDFFLHVFPYDKEDLPEAMGDIDFETLDFDMNDKEVPLPFWSSYKMIRVDAPSSYAIRSIVTGQLLNGEKKWSANINFQTVFDEISSITLANFTDKNWTDGVNNVSDILLLYNNPKNLWALKGAKQLKAGGSIIDVMNVTSDNQWIHVICPAKSDLSTFGYPNTIEIIK